MLLARAPAVWSLDLSAGIPCFYSRSSSAFGRLQSSAYVLGVHDGTFRSSRSFLSKTVSVDGRCLSVTNSPPIGVLLTSLLRGSDQFAGSIMERFVSLSSCIPPISHLSRSRSCSLNVILVISRTLVCHIESLYRGIQKNVCTLFIYTSEGSCKSYWSFTITIGAQSDHH